MSPTPRTWCAGAVALIAGSAAARAATYQWSWTSGDASPFLAHSDVAGAFASITTTFDDVTGLLSWDVGFSDSLTQGFTLVLTDGVYPTTEPDGLAILYFDGTNVANPRLSAFGWNGDPISTSHSDGNAFLGGNQTPDRIASSTDPSWIERLVLTDGPGGRRYGFTIDTTALNVHVPTRTPASGQWDGMVFGDTLGIMMRTQGDLRTGYDAKGFPNYWAWRSEGWFAGAMLPTDRVAIVPLPAAAGLGLAGLGAIGVRRRRR